MARRLPRFVTPLLLLIALGGPAAEAGESISDLASMSLEELAEYKV